MTADVPKRPTVPQPPLLELYASALIRLVLANGGELLVPPAASGDQGRDHTLYGRLEDDGTIRFAAVPDQPMH